jgi:CheY-like chemotaxis protein
MNALKILVVDDEASILQVLKMLLERGGHTVNVASSGEMALSMQERFDLAIIDLMMPVMDGIELSKKLREKLPAIKIILTSGYSQVEFEAKDINGFLQKPFGPDTANSLISLAFQGQTPS